VQVVYELTPVIAYIISAHCPGTRAREAFVQACIYGDWRKREKWSKECSPNHNGCAVGKMRAGILAQRYIKGVAAPGQAPLLIGETDPGIALQFVTNDGVASYDTITPIELALTETPA
jgi:hypothetical protein